MNYNKFLQHNNIHLLFVYYSTIISIIIKLDDFLSNKKILLTEREKKLLDIINEYDFLEDYNDN